MTSRRTESAPRVEPKVPLLLADDGRRSMDRHASVLGRATARVPGTCGELVQGTLGGLPFHVSCPVDVYSTVTVELTDRPGVQHPPDSPKAGAGARATLEHLGARVGARVSLRSDLPRGKGMGSSTADVAGAIGACARALDVELDAATVARLALSVEPTDGSVFPGIVLFDHRRGALFEPLGEAPPLEIAVLDFGGEVDTLEFNAVDRSELLRSSEPEVAEALSLVRRGIAEGQLDLLGRGATISALANQRVLPKPQLPSVLGFAEWIGALGVNVGHSGTVLGVLLDPARHDAREVLALARGELPGLALALACRLIGGGVVAVVPEC